ncbi:MAG TPA: tetratricopeptide repeat protein, partial [Thermoanaerobaculia bacterium]|nr:tetratricopeptide repeat protein [Thermoanaerobaculia bacterium]
ARVESHYKRGIALFHLERWRDAVAALRRTLELQPDRRDAHYYLAGCYRKLGDAAAAAREDAIFNAKP